MKYNKVIVFGANSFIASKVLRGFDFGDSEIFLVSRKSLDIQSLVGDREAKVIIIKNFKEKDVLVSLNQSLCLTKDENLLIINFIGMFGSLNSISEIDSDVFFHEFNQNVNPFLVLSKILIGCKSGLLISFSGAGIGGDKLEVACPSYLASKAAIAFLVEAFDDSNKEKGIRFSAVSPGAFASQMQEAVANAPDTSAISPKRREQALETLKARRDPTKLIDLLNFLAANPNSAGGRIWSANFDEIFNPSENSNFGKLRRLSS
jgi:short-subunit dehydrogenase